LTECGAASKDGEKQRVCFEGRDRLLVKNEKGRGEGREAERIGGEGRGGERRRRRRREEGGGYVIPKRLRHSADLVASRFH
jgi:hypothetical protein